jgi:serine/threonine-protein kinase
LSFWDSFRSLVSPKKKLDVEARFERLRSSVSGTMGDFNVAHDRVENRVVGLKLCDPEKFATFEARFKGLGKPTEGEIAQQMDHPLVMKTFDYGMTTKGQHYLISEFIEGPGLQQVVQKRDEKSLHGKRLTIVRQMAEAIEYVHEKGFIHRDVCPRNFICLEDMSGVKLIDFGLTVPAKREFMQPGNRTGTPLFMAPEIVRRRATDQRVDVFAFGVSAYSVCTFEYPWPSGDTTGRAALQHDTAPPVNILHYRPDLHPVLAKAIMGCMEADLNKRTPTMTHFLSQIRNLKSEFAEDAINAE